MPLGLLNLDVELNLRHLPGPWWRDGGEGDLIATFRAHLVKAGEPVSEFPTWLCLS